MPDNPTRRTLNHLKAREWVCDRVEFYNATTRRSRDFLGFVDVLAIDPDRVGSLAIQVTSYSNISARGRKICDDPENRRKAAAWLRSKNRLEVWGWKEFDKIEMAGPFLGGRWRPRIVEITARDVIKQESTQLF